MKHSIPRRPRGSNPCLVCDEHPCQNRDLIGPCHVFRGTKDKRWGHGRLRINKKGVLTHRLAWTTEVGPVPTGLVIDHMCRNPGCCNVDHLRVVTPKINATENVVGSAPQIMRAKTHCPHGHEYNLENTYINKASKGRTCRTCQREAQRMYKIRLKRALYGDHP